MNQILNYFYLVSHNLNYLGLLALIFLSVTLAVLGIFFLLTRQNILQTRLARLLPAGEAAQGKKPKLLEGEQNGLVVKLTKPLQDVAAPKQMSGKRKIRLKLMQAGFRSEAAYRNFLAAKVFLALLLPGVYLCVQFFLTFNPQIILISILLTIFGYFIPNIVVLHFT
ncbi:MAG: hypothetical protein P8Z70_07425, partial [Desulfuromonadales bacterium]